MADPEAPPIGMRPIEPNIAAMNADIPGIAEVEGLEMPIAQGQGRYGVGSRDLPLYPRGRSCPAANGKKQAEPYQ